MWLRWRLEWNATNSSWPEQQLFARGNQSHREAATADTALTRRERPRALHVDVAQLVQSSMVVMVGVRIRAICAKFGWVGNLSGPASATDEAGRSFLHESAGALRAIFA